jgi:hypothetical protein
MIIEEKTLNGVLPPIVTLGKDSGGRTTITRTANPSSSKMIVIADKHVTFDNPLRKTLTIHIHEAEPHFFIRVADDEYDSLGNAWSDDDLNNFIVSKLGLVVVSESLT